MEAKREDLTLVAPEDIRTMDDDELIDTLLDAYRKKRIQTKRLKLAKLVLHARLNESDGVIETTAHNASLFNSTEERALESELYGILEVAPRKDLWKALVPRMTPGQIKAMKKISSGISDMIDAAMREVAKPVKIAIDADEFGEDGVLI
jgi:hypothetical protein